MISDNCYSATLPPTPFNWTSLDDNDTIISTTTTTIEDIESTTTIIAATTTTDNEDIETSTMYPIARPTVAPTTLSPTIDRKGNITFYTSVDNEQQNNNGNGNGNVGGNKRYIDFNPHQLLSITAKAITTLNVDDIQEWDDISDIWMAVIWTCTNCPLEYRNLSKVDQVSIYKNAYIPSNPNNQRILESTLIINPTVSSSNGVCDDTSAMDIFPSGSSTISYELIFTAILLNDTAIDEIMQSSLIVRVSPPPKGGECAVYPSTSGTAFTTLFKINCSNFESNTPLTYQYYLPSQYFWLSDFYTTMNSHIEFYLGSGQNISIEAVVGNSYNYICYPLMVQNVVLDSSLSLNATAFLVFLESQGTSVNSRSEMIVLASQTLQILADPSIDYTTSERQSIIDYMLTSLLTKTFTDETNYQELLTQLTLTVQTSMLNNPNNTLEHDCVSRIQAIHGVLSELLSSRGNSSYNRADCATLTTHIYDLMDRCSLLSRLTTSSDNVDIMYQVLIDITLATLQNAAVSTQCSSTWNSFSLDGVQINRLQEQSCGDSDVNFRISPQWLEQSHDPLITCGVMNANINGYQIKEDYTARYLTFVVAEGQVSNGALTQKMTVNNCRPHRFLVDINRSITSEEMTECIFWDSINNNWSTEGCWVITIEGNTTECGCNHLNGTVFTARISDYHPYINYVEKPGFAEYDFVTIQNLRNHWISWIVPGSLLLLYVMLCLFTYSGSDKPLLSDQRSLFQAYLDSTYDYTHGGHEAAILEENNRSRAKCGKLMVLNCPQEHFCLSICCHKPKTHFAPRKRTAVFMMLILTILALTGIYYSLYRKYSFAEAYLVLILSLVVLIPPFIIKFLFQSSKPKEIIDPDKEEEARSKVERGNQSEKEQQLVEEIKKAQSLRSLTGPQADTEDEPKDEPLQPELSPDPSNPDQQITSQGTEEFEKEPNHLPVSSHSDVTVSSPKTKAQNIPIYSPNTNATLLSTIQVPELQKNISVSYDMTADDIDDKRSRQYANKMSHMSWDNKSTPGQKKIKEVENKHADAYAFQLTQQMNEAPEKRQKKAEESDTEEDGSENEERESEGGKDYNDDAASVEMSNRGDEAANNRLASKRGVDPTAETKGRNDDDGDDDDSGTDEAESSSEKKNSPDKDKQKPNQNRMPLANEQHPQRGFSSNEAALQSSHPPVPPQNFSRQHLTNSLLTEQEREEQARRQQNAGNMQGNHQNNDTMINHGRRVNVEYDSESSNAESSGSSEMQPTKTVQINFDKFIHASDNSKPPSGPSWSSPRPMRSTEEGQRFDTNNQNRRGFMQQKNTEAADTKKPKKQLEMVLSREHIRSLTTTETKMITKALDESNTEPGRFIMSNTIRQYLLNKQYILPRKYKNIAWIIWLLWVIVCFLIIVVCSLRFSMLKLENNVNIASTCTNATDISLNTIRDYNATQEVVDDFNDKPYFIELTDDRYTEHYVNLFGKYLGPIERWVAASAIIFLISSVIWAPLFIGCMQCCKLRYYNKYGFDQNFLFKNSQHFLIQNGRGNK